MNSIPGIQWWYTNQYSLSSQTSFYYLKLQPCGRQMVQHISWSQGHSTSLYISESISLSRLKKVDLTYFLFFSFFIFLFDFISLFFIFRTTEVRVDWSCCHIKSPDGKVTRQIMKLGEFSRRFENKWHYITWTSHVDLMDYTWWFRVGCTVFSMDHL